MKKIKVNEIYYSIQGESSLSGLPCIFIRLTYCNLRCSYCDSEYAFYDGKDMTIDEILSKISVDTMGKMEKLHDMKYEDLIEFYESL